MPFAWAGVRVRAATATTLRVRPTPVSGDTVAVLVADGAGGTVATVDALSLRPLAAATDGPGRAGQLWSLPGSRSTRCRRPPGSGGTGRCPRHRSRGGLAGAHRPRRNLAGARRADRTAAGTGRPDRRAAPGVADDVVAGTHATVQWALGLSQRWLTDDRYADSRLVVVTRGAVAVRDGESPTLSPTPPCGACCAPHRPNSPAG